MYLWTLENTWVGNDIQFSCHLLRTWTGLFFQVRRLRRTNTILEAVRLYKVIDDPAKLYKLIADNEKNEGFDGKMDRKSLHRILSTMAEQGFVKNIRIKLKLGQKTKEMLFICDPNIDESHTIIQSAMEQVVEAEIQFLKFFPKLATYTDVFQSFYNQNKFCKCSISNSFNNFNKFNFLSQQKS